jgi:hypothetical protein
LVAQRKKEKEKERERGREREREREREDFHAIHELTPKTKAIGKNNK